MSSSSSSELELEIFQYIDGHQSDFIKVGTNYIAVKWRVRDGCPGGLCSMCQVGVCHWGNEQGSRSGRRCATGASQSKAARGRSVLGTLRVEEGLAWTSTNPTAVGILWVWAARGSAEVPKCTCVGEASQTGRPRTCFTSELIFVGLLLTRRGVSVPCWLVLSFLSMACEEAET